MTTADTAGFKPGLEGVIAAETRLSRVDGERGELIIAGYPLETVALHRHFEWLTYLLWFGQEPTDEELDRFVAELAGLRAIPAVVVDLLRAAAAEEVPPMAALRIGAGAVDLDQKGLDQVASGKAHPGSAANDIGRLRSFECWAGADRAGLKTRPRRQLPLHAVRRAPV